MWERTPAETTFLHFLSALYRLSMQSCAPTQSAFSYPLSFPRLCQHSFPLPLPVATVNSFVLSCYGTTNISHPVPAGHTYPLRCFAPQWARFDNRHSTSAPTPTLTASAAATGAISRPLAPERVSAGDSFAPRRERFLCLRRPHFFQQRKKWGKERRQKLRFCTSSARYACSLPPALSLT